MRVAEALGGRTRCMALIIFFRGINVGGHRTFRASMLARELGAYDGVNVGAAGTFVVRKPGSRTNFLAEQGLAPEAGTTDYRIGLTHNRLDGGDQCAIPQLPFQSFLSGWRCSLISSSSVSSQK